MGFFTGLGNAARQADLGIKYAENHGGGMIDVFRDPNVGGLSNFPRIISYPNTAFAEGLERFNQGYTGPITGKVRDMYGLNTAEAGYLAKGMPVDKESMDQQEAINMIRNDRVMKKARQNKANPKAAANDEYRFSKGRWTGKKPEAAGAVQRNMEMRAGMGGPPQAAGVRYTDVPIPQRGGGQFQVGGTDPGNIPGIGAVNIKMHSPTQAEQVLAGMGTSPVQLSDVKANLLEEKGFRNAEAAERVRFAQEALAQGGSPSSISDAVDVLNATEDAGRTILEDRMNDSVRVANLREKQENRGFQRGTESPDFVGEGMFGRVDRIAPGYVEKKQAPVTEWPLGGKLYDARDVEAEVNQLNHLERLGITPKVEAFNINPDGSTEVVMRDLTQNFEPGEQVFESIADDLQNSSNPKGVRMAGDRLRKISIARNQQEGMAAVKGIELRDRHPGNFMVNKLTDRPIQIDPSGRAVEGFERDALIGGRAVDAMQDAGLTEEAGILDGLLREAVANQDPAMFKDLAQQGFSRAMKLKRGIDQDYFVANSAMVMPQND